MGGWNESVLTAKLSVSESKREFLYNAFYHRSSTRHFGCMNVLENARACDPVCMRYRLGEMNYLYGYRYEFI